MERLCVILVRLHSSTIMTYIINIYILKFKIANNFQWFLIQDFPWSIVGTIVSMNQSMYSNGKESSTEI